jgi:hypothetical protein
VEELMQSRSGPLDKSQPPKLVLEEVLRNRDRPVMKPDSGTKTGGTICQRCQGQVKEKEKEDSKSAPHVPLAPKPPPPPPSSSYSRMRERRKAEIDASGDTEIAIAVVVFAVFSFGAVIYIFIP